MSSSSEHVSREIETFCPGKNTKSSPDHASDDSQRDFDITTPSDKQRTAPPNIGDLIVYDGDGGSGDVVHADRGQVAEEDERESERARQAIYEQWDEEERKMKALEAEEWALKRKAPIQAHLQALHQAYRNVDPEYTVFAFGGTISGNEIDAGNLTLHVSRRVSVVEAGSRFDGQMRKKGNVDKRRKKGTRSPKK